MADGVKFDAKRLSDCSFEFKILHRKLGTGFLNGRAKDWDELSRIVGPLVAAGWYLVSCTAMVDTTDFVNLSIEEALQAWREKQNAESEGASAKEAGQGSGSEAAPEGPPSA